MVSLLHRKVAFTLIELMVVIAIMGVLAAALYPQVGKYISRGRDAGRITALANIGSALDSSRFDYDGKYPDHTGGCVPMTTLVTKHYLVSAIESPSGTGYNEGCGTNGQYAYGNLGIGNILMSTMENPQGGNYSGSTAGFTGAITKTGILNALNTKKGAGQFYVRPTNYIMNSAIFMASSSGSCGSPQIANTCAAGTVSNYVTASCGGTETWTCLGSSGSVNDSCSAVRVCSTGGTCGTAAGTPTATYPASGLCNDGTATPNDTVGTDGVFNWSCNGGTGAVACSAARQYTVTFNGNGGSGHSPSTLAVGYNSVLGSLPSNPTNTGNAFNGWFTATTGGTTVTTATVVTNATTYYAQWSVANYVVAFDTNGGSPIVSQNIVYNNTATDPGAPTKTGYNFAGWYSDVGLTSVWSFSTAITEDTTIYAKWNAIPYTVSGSFGATGATASISGCNGKTATADASGNFTFSNVPYGTACNDIYAAKTGYLCTTTTNGPNPLTGIFSTVAGNCSPTANMCVIGIDALDSGIINSCLIQCDSGYGWDAGSLSCIATVNASCGSANGVATISYPAVNLCAPGTVVNTDTTGSDGTYNWDCNGSGGGGNVSCSASKTIINGICGSSVGNCLSGTPSGLDSTKYDCTDTFNMAWGSCMGSVACDNNIRGSRNPTTSSWCSIYSVCWGDGSYDTGTRGQCKRKNTWTCLGSGGYDSACSINTTW